MNSLGMFISDIEIYSIDEAFMRFDNLTSQDLFKDAINIRKKILQWTGIPTSLGIAHTKTLSKIANHIAKKKTKEGVFDMRSTDIQLRVMKDMPVEEIWGISRGWGDKLRSIGIYTALQLRNSNAKFVRSHLGVVLERIIYELRGLPCLEIEKISPKKSIVSSKSFGKPIGSIEPIEEALSSYASRACKKLRDQMSKTQELCVFISTNPFQQKKPQYRNSATFKFDLPTSDTSAVINKSKELLRLIYRQGYQYHKCGIMLLEIIPKNYNQGHFFSDGDSLNRDKTMKLVDNINNLMGPETLFYLSQGVSKSWKMQSKSRSLRYTTQWEEIPRIL
jgi:DNA polymerase V